MEESGLNKCLFAVALLGSIVGCAGSRSPSAPPPARPSVYRVLFIGNSLTYTNDLPGTVAAMALGAGDTANERERENAFGQPWVLHETETEHRGDIKLKE